MRNQSVVSVELSTPVVCYLNNWDRCSSVCVKRDTFKFSVNISGSSFGINRQGLAFCQTAGLIRSCLENPNTPMAHHCRQLLCTIFNQIITPDPH